MSTEASPRNELEEAMNEISIDSKDNDKMESLDKKISLLSSNRNFRTFTVLPSVLSEISQHLMQDTDGVDEKTYGALYGTLEVPNIVVHKTSRLPYNINELSDEYLHKFREFEFLGLYSLGDFPNDEDVDKFAAFFIKRSRLNFLLKVERNQETDDISLKAFEAPILPFKSLIRRNRYTKSLVFLQLHTNPDCEGIVKRYEKTSDTSRIFYIQYLTSRVPEYEILDSVPLEGEPKPKKKFPGVKPSWEEHQETLCSIAEKEGIQAMELRPKNLKKKSEYLSYLEKIAMKGQVEITFTFRVDLEFPKKQERVLCWSTVLNCQIVGAGSNMEKGFFSAVCSTLAAFGAF